MRHFVQSTIQTLMNRYLSLDREIAVSYTHLRAHET